MSERKIIKITAENFMRLKAVSISPAGDIVYITGANGEGKSSILNAICAALNWRDVSGQIPEPIHQGERKAVVSIDLGDMIVTRTWTPSGTQLKVESKDGAEYKKPQQMLDKFFSRIGFDPLEFIRMQPREQRQTLIDLLGVDFSEMDNEKESLLKSKLTAQNDIIGLNQRIKDIGPIQEGIQNEELSASDIINQIQDAQTFNQKLKTASDGYGDLTRLCLDIEYQIKQLQEQLKEIFEKRESHIWNSLKDETPVDIEPLKIQLQEIESINKNIRKKQEFEQLLDARQFIETRLEALSQSIRDIDQDKKDILESAKFPVKGLSFDESGVLFNNVSLKQASTAEQIRVSLAIGISMNPSLKVLLIRDGSLLDIKSRQLIADMAAEYGMQVWVEAVDESGKVGFVIEDGEIKQPSNGQQVLA